MANGRRRRWTAGVVIGIVILMVAALALALLPPPAPSPVVDEDGETEEEALVTPTPEPPDVTETSATEGPVVACDGDVPAASQQEKPTFTEPPTAELDPEAAGYRATMATSCGDIVIDLYADRAPRTVENFVALARMGYYGGVTFHRVVEGFVIQAGAPTGTGAGDPGYTIEGELEAAEDEGYRRGIVAMANRGGDPSTASTQFFIMHQDNDTLPPQYAVFGEVAEGMDVVDTIAAVPTRVVDGQQDVPTETVYIESVTIEELPDDGGS